MSRNKARYSLRSQCERTACDCRNSHDLPCSSRRRSVRFNTSGSDATPSGYSRSPSPSDSSDIGFSEEFDFDDSSSTSTRRISDTLSHGGSSAKSAYSKNSLFSDKISTTSVQDIRVINNTLTLTTNQSRNSNLSSHLNSYGMQKHLLNGGSSHSRYNKNSTVLSNPNRFDEEPDPAGRTRMLAQKVDWFLKLLKWIGFPIYWCLVHIVLVEKWVLDKVFNRQGEGNTNMDTNSYLSYRGERNYQQQQGRFSTNSYNYNNGSYISTPTTAAVTKGHTMAEMNGKFFTSSKGMFGGKKIFGMEVTRLFSSSVSESGGFMSKFKSTMRSDTSESGRYVTTESVTGSESGRLLGMGKTGNGSEFGGLGSNKGGTVLVWKKNGGVRDRDAEENIQNMAMTAETRSGDYKNFRLRSQAHLEQQRQQQLSSGYVLGNNATKAGASSSVDGFKITNGRMQKRGRGWKSNSLIESDDEDGENDEEVEDGGSFGICGFCLRLLVLCGLMAILFYLAYLLWPAATSLAYWTWAFVTSCLSTLVSGSAGIFTFVASSLPISTSEIKEVNDHTKVPSSESIYSQNTAGQTTDRVSVHTLPTVPPAISKEDYNAILEKLKRIEETLEIHQEKLAFHEISHTRLQQQIVQLDAAMKAATTKGKTTDEIFLEIMNFKIGETSNGQVVTLRSLMKMQDEKDQQADIKLDLKLQSMADKFKADTQSWEEKFKVIDGQLHAFKEDKKNTVTETRIVAAEVDYDKIKGAIMPDLMAGMENQVKISCLTRDCPEIKAGAGVNTAEVEKLINMAISKYDADKTGSPDLALESAGGSILSTRCTKSSKLRNSVVSLWGFRIWSPPNNPRTLIQPGVVPGECWAFEGSVGDVVIRLVAPSIVTGFTVEHIPKIISPYGNIDSAPYKFQVLGLHGEDDLDTAHDYGTFSYEDNGEPLQYFSASNITTTPYPIVELKILSNHGNLLHTCLYRFRVHGALAIGGSQFTATVQTASEV